MNPRVLRRFIILMAVLTVGVFFFTDFFDDFLARAPGDLSTELGGQRLDDELYDDALELYDRALAESPNHRGALMGRALVFIRTERYEQAIAELDVLIEHLGRTLEQDDATGRGVLAAAYANRGIVKDRIGAYQGALEDYIEALKIDADAVDEPGIVHKILYGSKRISSVHKRAQYLYEQFQKPEEERVMRIPELDDLQRMHKP